MHDKDFDIYEFAERLQKEIVYLKKDFDQRIESMGNEITLLKNEVDLLKIEGCWLSKQNSNYIQKDTNE